VRFVLLDATAKKIRVVERAALAAGARNVETVDARAEDLAQQAEYRGQFQFATARAVGALVVQAELVLPFLAQGGMFFAQKGAEPHLAEEIDAARFAIKHLGGALEEIHEIADEQGGRLVCVRKIAETPPRFHRRSGIPAKRPLHG